MILSPLSLFPLRHRVIKLELKMTGAHHGIIGLPTSSVCRAKIFITGDLQEKIEGRRVLDYRKFEDLLYARPSAKYFRCIIMSNPEDGLFQ